MRFHSKKRSHSAVSEPTRLSVPLLGQRLGWRDGLAGVVCYAGVVSPVLGFAQSGPQLVADKYAYLACLPWALLGKEPGATPNCLLDYFPKDFLVIVDEHWDLILGLE